MAHPLKDYAKSVQHELEKDTTLERPTYQWCLLRVNEFISEAKENAKGDNPKMIKDHVKELLVQRIKPIARKAGQ
jgi:hypothetical protein